MRLRPRRRGKRAAQHPRTSQSRQNHRPRSGSWQRKVRARVASCCLIDTDRTLRPEQLLLEDDPSFLPDLALAPFDFDLSTFEASLTAESPLTSLSPHTPTTSSGTAFGGPVGGLVIPTSDTGAVGDIGGFIVPGDDGLGAAAAPGDDEGFLPEADFSFDAEGNLLDFSVAGAAPRPSVPGTGAAAGIGVVTAASARVRAEHAAGVAAGVPVSLHESAYCGEASNNT